jgi:membrane-associated phospholipid phosphatase
MSYAADIVSLTILLIIPVAIIAYAWTNDTRFLISLVAVGVVSIGAWLCQRWIPYKRPPGAENCNVFNQGNSFKHINGFPSGHVSIVTAFCVTMMLVIQRPWAYVLGSIWIASMTWSRVSRRCHDGPQVVGGVVFGTLVAWLCYITLLKISYIKKGR